MENLFIFLYFVAAFIHIAQAKRTGSVAFALIGLIPVFNLIVFYFIFAKWIRS